MLWFSIIQSNLIMSFQRDAIFLLNLTEQDELFFIHIVVDNKMRKVVWSKSQNSVKTSFVGDC